MPACFRIRPAIRGDISFLERCAHEAYEQYVKAIGRKPAPMVFDFKARLDRSNIDVFEDETGPFGYMVWKTGRDHIFLESIAILPGRQGEGCARRAISHLEVLARSEELAAIELYTNEKMTGNLTLYPHLGFHETNRVREDGFNRVYFRKVIEVQN
ncbi:MAG: GNAT family N-acetyltransferase [Ahrensia sp.]|nr:GNAT family N-acetyltransferase [Ahrensia sp.]